MEVVDKWHELPYVSTSNMQKSIAKFEGLADFLYSKDIIYKVFASTVLVDDDAKGYAQRSELEFTVYIKKEGYVFYVIINSEGLKLFIEGCKDNTVNMSVSTKKSNTTDYDVDSFYTLIYTVYNTQDVKGFIELLQTLAPYNISNLN